MSKPIAGVNKLPFSTNGIEVQGAVLSDGTIIQNARIFKQRSSRQFDIIDVATNEIHRKLTITGTDSNGVDFALSDSIDEILAKMKPSQFFIRTIDENGDPIGFILKLYLNLVHLSNGNTQFISDYSTLFAKNP